MFPANPLLFVVCLIVGAVGMWPRIAYAARRAASPSSTVEKPTLMHHVALTLPSLAVLIYLVLQGDFVGALVMAVLFVALFALGIVALRARQR